MGGGREIDMNVIKLLLRKSSVCYIYDSNTLRQGLEKMRIYGYTAVPVISDEGIYVGCVSEGDFLWHIIATGDGSMRSQEQYKIKDIIRYDYNPAVKIDVSMDVLLQRALHQNFIPVTDDRGAFIGIVTRADIIKHCTKPNIQSSPRLGDTLKNDESKIS